MYKFPNITSYRLIHYINLLVINDDSKTISEYRIVRSSIKFNDYGFVRFINKLNFSGLDHKQLIIDESNLLVDNFDDFCDGKCKSIIKHEPI